MFTSLLYCYFLRYIPLAHQVCQGYVQRKKRSEVNILSSGQSPFSCLPVFRVMRVDVPGGRFCAAPPESAYVRPTPTRESRSSLRVAAPAAVQGAPRALSMLDRRPPEKRATHFALVAM